MSDEAVRVAFSTSAREAAFAGAVKHKATDVLVFVQRAVARRGRRDVGRAHPFRGRVGGWAVWKARPVEAPVPAPIVMLVGGPMLEVERGDLRLYELPEMLTAAVGDRDIADLEVPHRGD